MGRRTLGLCLSLALPLLGTGVAAQSPEDPEVAKGIKLVEQGEYDSAIFALDDAARRLSADPKKTKELSDAYLYLGIAYLGKGHEAAAKAKFREAVKQIRDLNLSPEKFAPRVINLVEAAKAELGTPAAKPAVAPAQKKGGSKKLLLFGGLGVAAAGGAAVALSGGGGDSGGDGGCDTVYAERSGLFRQPSDPGIEVRPQGASDPGPWTAEITWTPADQVVQLFVLDPGENVITVGNTISPGKQRAEWQGAAGVQYIVRAYLDEAGTSANFTLVIQGPCL